MKKVTTNIMVELTGARDLMFDRYAGDNNTKLPPEDMMYLRDLQLMLPALNIFSLLTAENTKSVCRQFLGKQGKSIGMGIKAYCNIEPFDIPILDGEGKPIFFSGFNDRIYVRHDVARVKGTNSSGGIPNPKTRPVLRLPWSLKFTIAYTKNDLCTLENLKQAIEQGGTLGVGTFRPFFGRYDLTVFEPED